MRSRNEVWHDLVARHHSRPSPPLPDFPSCFSLDRHLSDESQDLVLISEVGEWDPAEIVIGDLNAPNLLCFKPALDGQPAMLGTSWGRGAPPATPLADQDSDTMPDAFDNCVKTANPDQSNSDEICLLGHLFSGRPEKQPCGDESIPDAGNIGLLDSNDDKRIDLSVAVAVFSFLFSGGEASVHLYRLDALPASPSTTAESPAASESRPRLGPLRRSTWTSLASVRADCRGCRTSLEL